MNHESMKLTKFDSKITSPSMQMAKAVIPYINPGFASMLGIFIKVQELKNAASINFSGNPSENVSSGNLGFLSDLKDFLGEDERDQLDMMLSIMELFRTINPEDMNVDFMDQYMNLFNEGENV
ncbi:MAG: hypothetical protein K6G85_02295 [Eubacterium sp.]|nr:hypothetical protein [Eubacterium sp.]